MKNAPPLRGHHRSVLHLLALAAGLLLAGSGKAQGILTITPGRTVTTIAGIGTVSYSGDNAAATGATLANPSSLAYDVAGNLFIADTNNHVVRERIKASGNIVTVAGTGTAGFSGDGAAATSAQLDTPTGVAVDLSGNLYIADSHNQRIRKVTGSTITTIAGTGTAGFSGDNAAAVAAQFSLPSSVAVDAAGNVYIADTNNQRIRRITGATITTIAGTGTQSYSGDGAAATLATLDSPSGVAVDAAGDVYIADRHNQRIRRISTSGIITTIAGSGGVTFAGGFAGDGLAATSSMLSKPTGVSIDAAGNVYIADTNNQRIRQVSGTTIATVEGDDAQGFSGDGGPATSAALNAPKSAAPDAGGNLAVADSLDQRVRTGTLGTLTFSATPVGASSAAQPVTLSNTGTAPLSISSETFTGTFGPAAGGTCSSTPITLAAGASCTTNIVFLPTGAGAAAGAVSFSGSGVITQTVLLAASATVSATTTTVTSSLTAPFINQTVVFTATVKPLTGSGVPAGNVTFFANGSSLGSVALNSSGVASISTAFTVAGSYPVTAVYAGGGSFTGSTSPMLTQLVGDFSFTIQPAPGQSHDFNITVLPGQSGVYQLTVSPLNGPFTFPITLSAVGLPSGATAAFNPSTIVLGSSPANFTLTVQTSNTSAALQRLVSLSGATVLAWMLLPFGRRMRLRGKRLKTLLLLPISLAGLFLLGGLSGCGSGAGFFGQPQKTYDIQVVATATGGGATLQHVATVHLTIQ